MEFTITSKVFGEDALLARWTAAATAGTVDDGVDTFVFTDGKISLQSAWFTIEPTA